MPLVRVLAGVRRVWEGEDTVSGLLGHTSGLSG